MQSITLEAKSRKELKKKVNILREQGQTPAVLYGQKIKTQNLSVKSSVFEKIYKTAGESTLIDLAVDEQKPVKILVQQVQFDPVKHKIIHIDFYQVRMDEKITAAVPLVFEGEAPAVKEQGGTLITTLSEVEIECLPGDLIHEIKINITKLNTFDDIIHVKDLPVPENVKITKNEDEVVASVMAPRTEEELKELEKAPEETPEGEEGAEGAEGAEGEAKAEQVTEEKPKEDKK